MNGVDTNDQTLRNKTLSDEVLRKIGRNVLLFQKIEYLLKHLMANHRMEGTITSIEQRQKEQAERINQLTLGGLVGEYTDNILSDAGESPSEPENLIEPWISFRFSRSYADGSGVDDSLRSDMKKMVGARNELIHHFLPRWQPDSLEQLAEAVVYLDEQHESVLPMIAHYEGIAKAMRDGRELHAAFLASEDGQRQMEVMWLQISPLITVMREIVNKATRPDGWTLLARAGALVRVNAADEVAHLKERYGHLTLKKLLIASELFDVWDEPLSNGRFRTLYRLKQTVT